jgi:hypothetical protein
MLLSAVLGGLLRVGALGPVWLSREWVGLAAVSHAALMLSAFLGSVIAVERAVALRQRWAFAAPLASVAGGGFILAGLPLPGAGLGVVAALVFVAVNVVLVQRQRFAHTVLLLVGACAWLIGNLLLVLHRDASVALLWWFVFVVLTITAERLEMTRLMRHHPWARPLLLLVVSCLLLGATVSVLDARGGGLLFGAALTALAFWLGTFDIARRTVHAHGLSRYMALCLLGSYVWLACAGAAWIGMVLGYPVRDLALHALGLGFIFSMVMGHAPVILPAVARVKLLFGPWFYGPLVLLHASLLMRAVGAVLLPAWHARGALLNALTLALFALTVAGSAVAWQLQGRSRRAVLAETQD